MLLSTTAVKIHMYIKFAPDSSMYLGAPYDFNNISITYKKKFAQDWFLFKGMLNQINHKFFPQGPDFVIPDMKLIDQPKVQITYHCNDKVDPQFHPNSGNLVGRVLFIMNAQ